MGATVLINTWRCSRAQLFTNLRYTPKGFEPVGLVNNGELLVGASSIPGRTKGFVEWIRLRGANANFSRTGGVGPTATFAGHDGQRAGLMPTFVPIADRPGRSPTCSRTIDLRLGPGDQCAAAVQAGMLHASHHIEKRPES